MSQEKPTPKPHSAARLIGPLTLKQTLDAAPLEVIWSPDERIGSLDDSRNHEFEIALEGFEDEASYSAALTENEAGKPIIETDLLFIDEDLRGNHLSSRLSRALGYVAAENNCHVIEANFLNPVALKAYSRVFGFERIHFAEQDGKPYEPTLEEAIQLIKERRKKAEDIYKGKPRVVLANVKALRASIDVEGLDVTGWEMPKVVIETDNPHLQLRQMTTVEEDKALLKLNQKNEDHFEAFGNTVMRTLEEVTASRQEPGKMRFGIYNDGELIGMSGFKVRDNGKAAEIGHLLDKHAEGHGYATLARDALTVYLAQRYDRVFAESRLDNVRAHKSLARSGYEPTGEVVERDWGDMKVFEYKRPDSA